MYPTNSNPAAGAKQIDPESLSNASSSDGIIVMHGTGGGGKKQSRWDQLQDSLGVFWITKQILPKDADRLKVVKTTLRELLTYMAFLMTITYSMFSVYFILSYLLSFID